MLKGTITAPNEDGVSTIEIKNTSDGILGLCSKIAVAAVVATAGCIANHYTNKMLDYIEKKKDKDEKKKTEEEG